MTVEQLIKDLQSYKTQNIYFGPLICQDWNYSGYVQDILVKGGYCYIFYENTELSYYSAYSLVADLSRYSHQKSWEVLFVNVDTNEIYTRENSMPDYSGVTLILQP